MVHNPVKEFVPLKEVKVGQEVCIAELNQLATVLALPDKNGDVLVRAGIIKTKVPLKGLKQPEKLVKEPTEATDQSAAAVFPPDRRCQPSQRQGRARYSVLPKWSATCWG